MIHSVLKKGRHCPRNQHLPREDISIGCPVTKLAHWSRSCRKRADVHNQQAQFILRRISSSIEGLIRVAAVDRRQSNTKPFKEKNERARGVTPRTRPIQTQLETSFHSVHNSPSFAASLYFYMNMNASVAFPPPPPISLRMSEEQRQNHLNMEQEIEEPLYAVVNKRRNKTIDLHAHMKYHAVHQLENYYGGSASWAAVIIQRAFRKYKLKNKFNRLMSLSCSKNNHQLINRQNDDIDTLILQAAGLDINGRTSRPSQRRIRRPIKNVRRSMSLKDNRRQSDNQPNHRSRDDLELPLPPPPPPPQTEHLDHYSVIYDQEINQFKTPKPPQRTVSFLNGPSLPRKISAIPPQPETIYHGYTQSQPVGVYSDEDSIHNRSYSSPSVISPPPYAYPPPPNRCESPLPPPPPPMETEVVILDNRPLPPPPPPIADFIKDHRPSSTSSSVSSIDSGYPAVPSSPIRRSPDTQSWITSPNFIVSPDSVQQIREMAYEQQQPRRNCVDTSLDTSYCDIYGHISKNGMLSHQQIQRQQQQQQQQVIKKQVRIHTPSMDTTVISNNSYVVDDSLRKRQYRVGLNLYNQNPERGMEYLLKKNFVDYSPIAVAKFLLGRKGLSKKMMGEYLTNLQRPFNLAVLHCFVHEIDFSGLHLDIALRQLQQEVTLPGEAQKIEKMIEVFSKRYIQCNQMFVSSFKSPDTIFVLSYAMVLLNTDLHSPALAKNSSRQMKREDFIRNLRGVDSGNDLDAEMLRGIYDRIRNNEFRPGPDHHTQVQRVEENIKGNYDKSIGGRLAEPHRRLVCFCRLTEVQDIAKKEKTGSHQRGVFLFNDLLVVTKTINKKKTGNIHQYRYSIPLRDIKVQVFGNNFYPYGINIRDKFSGRDLASFNAKSEIDQQRFVNDLRESSAETVEMEKARLFIEEAEEML